LGLARETVLIGLAARFDPQKDHRNFVQAAALLHPHFPEVHFLFCGEGITWDNQELVGWIAAAGIGNRCHLLGRREDMPRLTAALDLASLSSSYGEGFPNVLGEAMACAVPCVVTNVGDSALIVGNTGLVVPPRSPEQLAAGWRAMLGRGSARLRQAGEQARSRIAAHYSLHSVTKAYEALYKGLAVRGSAASS
jgi:glycosyltransferase involved in cell wall biosynthesis